VIFMMRRDSAIPKDRRSNREVMFLKTSQDKEIASDTAGPESCLTFGGVTSNGCYYSYCSNKVTESVG